MDEQPDERVDLCVSCGSTSVQRWDTPEGRVAMCTPCATVHGIACA